MKRREPEQLNRPSASEEYQLEDILREFGAGKQKRGVSDDTAVFRTVQPEEIRIAQPKKKQAPPTAGLSDDTQRLPTLAELQKAGAKLTPPAPPTIPLTSEDLAARRRAKQEPKPVHPSAPPAPTAKSILAKNQHGLMWLRLRVWLVGLLALTELFLLFWQEQLPAAAPLSPAMLSGISIVLFVLTLLLSREVLVRALTDLLHLRMGVYVPSAVAAALALLHAVQNRATGETNYCALVSALFFFLLYAIFLERTALSHTLRAVSSFDAPMGIFDTPHLLNDADSLRRDTGDTSLFLQKLLQPDRPQKLLRIYTWLLLPLSCLLAYLLSQQTQTTFVLAWLLLLLGGIPFSAALSYVRPFAALSKRLAAFGGALCGWHGAKVFGGRHTIILRDDDLFPSGTISSNGMKLFGAYKPSRVIACTLAALETAGSPLVSIFDTLLQAQYGKHLRATVCRFYDDGGIGAEVGGDVVLVGSLSFMRAMGVHMPDGTRVRLAVYTSINGELAGIFALKYKTNASTRAGLHDILANRNFSVVLATRDFLITPDLLTAKYDVITQAVEFPPFQERLRLSESDPSEATEQGALIARDTFGAFASTVAAGRTLRISSLLAVWMSLLSGVLGLALCTLMIAWSALASPLHIAAFQLLWSIAAAFVSWILLKF